MATEKHKTTLEIAVEDRLLRQFGASLKRVFSTEPVDRFRRAQAGVTQELDKQTRAAERAAAATGATGGGARRDSRGRFIPGTGGGGGGGGMGGAGGAGGRRQPLSFGQTVGAGALGGMIAGGVGRMSQAGAGIAGGTGATAMALGAIPFVGPALQAAVQAAQSLTDIAVGQAQQQAATAGVTGMGAVGGMGLGKLGVGPTQVPGRMAALAQQSGMRGRNLRGLAAAGALRMQELTGISGGAMAGALGTGGGGQNPKRAMQLTEEAIAAGLASGIREGKLPQFIQAIADNIEAMRKQGIQVDPRGLPNLVRQLSKVGPSLQGAAGVTAAKGAVAAIKGAGKGGGFMDALALQTAMGTTDPKTGKNLTSFQAELAIEANPEKFIPLMMDKIGQMGGTPEGKAKLLQNWQGGSLAQAFDIARGASAGKFAGRSGKREMFTGRAFVTAEAERQRGGRGLAAQAADIEARQIAGGRDVAGDVFGMRKTEVGMARRGAKLGAAAGKMVTGAIDKYSGALSSDDPIGAVMDMFAKDLQSMFSSVFDELSTQIGKGVKDAFGIDPEAAGAELQKLLSTPEGLKEIMQAVLDILKDIFRWNKELFGNFKYAIPGVGAAIAVHDLVTGE